MPKNPTTEGPEKSLRQVAPGGDVVAGVFAAIALLVIVGMVRTLPPTAVNWIFDLLLIAAFGGPAFILYSGARNSGLFIDDAHVVYRVLGRLRGSWPRSEVGEIEPMSGGLRLRGTSGSLLREFKFRWWRTDQVAELARATGLAAPTAVEALAAKQAEAAAAVEPTLDPEVHPGEPGQG